MENPEVNNRPKLREITPARLADYGIAKSKKAQNLVGKTFKQILDEKGPFAVSSAVLKEKKLLITDTTFRDAHQSLIATRMRTNDMLGITDLYEERFKKFILS